MHIELEALKKRLYIDSKVANVKFFPGSNRDVSPEEFAGEINKFFADAQVNDTTLNVDEELDA